jgi:ribonuclease D
LGAMAVFRGRAQRRLANYWYAAVAQALALDPAELPLSSPSSDGPPPVARWGDRDPAAAARLAAARAALAETAQQWSIPVENLLQPELLRRLCWSPPADGDIAGTLRAGGARDWQIELLLPGLDAALTRAKENAS